LQKGHIQPLLFFRLPSFAKHLQKLNISHNPKLTNEILQQLIQSACSDSSVLEDIIAINSGISGPLSVEFIDVISEKLSSATPLRNLQFSVVKMEKVDMESLEQVWRDKYDDLSLISCTDDIVAVSVAK